MNNEILSIRVSADNPNHNLWLNNGTWSVAYTVHLPNRSRKRIRQSLGTHQVALARRRRDDLFARYQAKDGRISAKAEELAVSPFNVTQFGVPERNPRFKAVSPAGLHAIPGGPGTRQRE